MRNLEAQVTALSAHLAQPGQPLPEFEDIAPRLNHIEQSLAEGREAILEAARKAAQDAVAAMSQAQADSMAVAGLAGELKSLEALARQSDERNAKTFEAIHDTLLKIVDRLGSLEQGEPGGTGARKAPPIDVDDVGDLFGAGPRQPPDAPIPANTRSPAEAAAAAASHALGAKTDSAAEASGARRSMLGGLTRAFRKDREPSQAAVENGTAAPEAGLDDPLDPKLANQPLEPGSGVPDLNAIVRRVRDERGSGNAEVAKADFIAAARRAAQAAAAEAQTTKRHSENTASGSKLKLGEMFKNRRKTMLLAATAVMVVLAGMQLSKAFLSGESEVAGAVGPAEQPGPLTAEALVEPQAPARQQPSSEAATADVAAQTEKTATIDEPRPAAPAMLPSQDGEAAEAPPASVAPMQTAAVDPDPVEPPSPAFEPAPADAGPVALREAADGGDPKAMFEIGSRYAEGRGVTSDMAKAAMWYERAAELGYAPAQYRVGNFYEKGNGVERDIATAKSWYEKAAKQGNASAMHNLAVLYAMGADGQADNDAAARWFLEAAELGVKDSQYNLGILAAKGAGMPQSLEESYKWFALVAKTGDRDAAAKRDEVAKALRPEQLEKARAAAELWKARDVDPETNMVEIPEEWTEGQPTAETIDMRQAVRNIQAILNSNGYDAGPADGLMGQKTKSAIIAFQADNGMTADGEVTEELVKALLERK